MNRRYDVIIVGASFAGLAVASRLRCRTLVIDQHPIGAVQLSACGTFLGVPEKLQLLDAVMSVNHRAVVHVPGVPAYTLEDPLCTLDYEAFCRGLYRNCDTEYLQAHVRGLAGSALAPQVVTDRGTFSAPCVVDASGWRAVLASSLRPGFVDHRALGFALETTATYPADAFYFWLNPERSVEDVGWIFPAGRQSRIGIGTYSARTVSAERVRRFLRPLGADAAGFHGGFLPHRLRPPVIGNVFLVGDAAGHCLPLTGEGIRPALSFGEICGDVLQEVFDGRLDLEGARECYRAAVRSHRRYYQLLELGQRYLPRLPRPLLRKLVDVSRSDWASQRALRHYTGKFPLLSP